MSLRISGEELTEVTSQRPGRQLGVLGGAPRRFAVCEGPTRYEPSGGRTRPAARAPRPPVRPTVDSANHPRAERHADALQRVHHGLRTAARARSAPGRSSGRGSAHVRHPSFEQYTSSVAMPEPASRATAASRTCRRQPSQRGRAACSLHRPSSHSGGAAAIERCAGRPWRDPRTRRSRAYWRRRSGWSAGRAGQGRLASRCVLIGSSYPPSPGAAVRSREAAEGRSGWRHGRGVVPSAARPFGARQTPALIVALRRAQRGLGRSRAGQPWGLRSDWRRRPATTSVVVERTAIGCSTLSRSRPRRSNVQAVPPDGSGDSYNRLSRRDGAARASSPGFGVLSGQKPCRTDKLSGSSVSPIERGCPGAPLGRGRRRLTPGAQ